MKVKVIITRGKIIVLTFFLLAILLLITLYPYIPFPIYSVNYMGVKMRFRVNLRDVKDVVVYPSEETIRKEIMNQLVENITIVFKPGENQTNAHYAIEVFEIVNKLAIAYKLNFAYMPNFKVVNVTSYENLRGRRENPIIALVHPVFSNETSVKLEDHVVYIQGRNATSLREQLKNFDLAVVKFLMSILEIKV
ncbi:MAG: hypothetical protein QW040_00175 [Candidatus Aenigmatarchaeota archaeon]